MSLYEEIEELKVRIKKSVDLNNTAKTSDLMTQAFSVCEKIKEVLKEAGPQETKDLNKLMTNFREFLSVETKRLSKKMNLTEEQLARHNENPENFSKEQWIVMQAIRKRFSAETKEIRKVVKNKTALLESASSKGIRSKLPGNLKALMEGDVSMTSNSLLSPELMTKKKKIVLRKVKKNKWIKS